MELSAALKSSTAELHRALESKMVPRIKAIRSLEDYRKVLELFYGFFGSLEINIDNCMNENLLPDFVERRKAGWLTNDLSALPGNAVPMPTAQTGSFIQNGLQALGALYVMEGSTLGGQVITGMIKRSLNDETLPLSFFSGYGENTMARWASFKTTLDGLDLNEAKQAQVVDAANETFKRFAAFIAAAE